MKNNAHALYHAAKRGGPFFRLSQSSWFLNSFCRKKITTGRGKDKEVTFVLDESNDGAIVKHLFSFMTGGSGDPVVTIVFSPYALGVGEDRSRCYWSFTLKQVNGTVSVLESGGFALMEDKDAAPPTKKKLLDAMALHKKLSFNGRLPTMRIGKYVSSGGKTGKDLFKMSPGQDHILMNTPEKTQIADMTFQELG